MAFHSKEKHYFAIFQQELLTILSHEEVSPQIVHCLESLQDSFDNSGKKKEFLERMLH